MCIHLHVLHVIHLHALNIHLVYIYVYVKLVCFIDSCPRASMVKPSFVHKAHHQHHPSSKQFGWVRYPHQAIDTGSWVMLEMDKKLILKKNFYNILNAVPLINQSRSDTPFTVLQTPPPTFEIIRKVIVLHTRLSLGISY